MRRRVRPDGARDSFANQFVHLSKLKIKWYLGVAQLVARYLGVVEAASSSLVTQTISSVHNRFQLWTLDIFYVCIYISLFGVAFCYSFSFRSR